ncbi:MAG: PQQ-dependent sugar dehydrogenase [Verrucomicrobiales bacterium]|nr:PQQ-dependent sugar dehydrogenase [Verrucomicrobiales bacterium]
MVLPTLAMQARERPCGMFDNHRDIGSPKRAGLTLRILLLIVLSIKGLVVAEERKAIESMEKLATPVTFTAIHSEKLKFDKPVWFSPVPGLTDTSVILEHRTGKAWLLHGTGDSARKTLFADWGEAVTDGPWEGLMCLAFHPDFSNNRRFFIKHETLIEEQRHTVVVEKRAAKDLQTDSGELSKQLLAVEQPADNHNGGTLAFGPDGYLYVAMGDGGPQEDPKGYTQSGQSFLGKMLRVDVDDVPEGRAYGIPKDNPFVDRDPDKWHHEIWALGFREPWRFSFDAKTGEVWLGDVGQVRYEEIALVKRGENHGWNVREGWEGFKDTYQRGEEVYMEPLLSYTRHLGASVTGGYVYRGERNPTWDGVYLFGDFATQQIYAMRKEGGKVTWQREVGKAPEPPASFGQGPGGELYVVGYLGTIFHIDLSKSPLMP